MTPVEVLQAVRAMLIDPTRWLHSDDCAEAHDAEGRERRAHDPEAVRWDIYGAICLAARKAGEWSEHACSLHNHAIDLVAKAIGHDAHAPGSSFLAMITWHDTPVRRHEEVIAMIDAAIRLGQAASEPDAGDS